MAKVGKLGPLLRKAKGEEWGKWIKSANDEAAVLEGYWCDEVKGGYVVEFFEDYLCHSQGKWARQPFLLMDWQKNEMIIPLFGWVHREQGHRRFHQLYCEVAKKNGKSTLGAGIGLVLLVFDNEPQAQVFSVATEREQARIVHEEAVRMVNVSPELIRRLSVNRTTATIVYQQTNSYYRALSSDAHSKEGLNISGAIIDELHAWKKRDLWETLKYGTVARRNPMTVVLTTAGIFNKTAIGWEQHDYATNVKNDVVINTRVLPCIHSTDKDEDWTKPKVWEKANPAIDIIIDRKELKEACKEAQEVPRLENVFRRYRLSQWVEQVTRWLPMAAWEKCTEPVVAEELYKHECHGGLDLASTTDLASLALDFKFIEEGVEEGDDGRVVHKMLWWYWCPEEAATLRGRRDKVEYLTWAKQGFIELTPGSSIDYRYIRRRLNELDKQFKITDIGFDPYNATHLAQELDEEDGFNMVQMRQGMLTMNEPSKEFERLIKNGDLHHGGNPVTYWMASNASVRTDHAGNIMPDKGTSTEKIDGVVAGVMALGRSMAQIKPKRSIYATRGLISV